MVISLKIHCQFSLHSRDISVRDNGFSDVHTLLPGSPLIRVNKTKRELIWTAIPAVNISHRFNKIRKWLCFKNGCRINITEPNQMILVYHWFHQKTIVYLMKRIICHSIMKLVENWSYDTFPLFIKTPTYQGNFSVSNNSRQGWWLFWRPYGDCSPKEAHWSV